MSAFDVAGAVMATPLFLAFCSYVLRNSLKDRFTPSHAASAMMLIVVLGLWSSFCIARLFGAHL